MADGIFAELDITGPAACQIPTDEFASTASINDIARSTTSADDGVTTEEFRVEHTDERSKSADDDGTTKNEAVRRVFAGSSETIYRFKREARGCVCDQIEAFGCPVRNISVAGNRITVLFIAPDIETLQQVVRELKEQFRVVSVRRLLRSEPMGDKGDLLFVDRSRLTDRQHEVLSVAHEMGYFSHPREANAEAVATALDISVSTFAEHLAAGQSKLMRSILGR